MKKIIHIDMDCFYAAIEMRDNPELRNVPIAVGGESDRRGVLCTSNYLARSFGVRSAMATSVALRLCPQLVLVKPHFEKYKEASLKIQEIFLRYTDQIEPLSLDEAYLDVTSSPFFNGSAQLMAKEIQTQIYKETGLTASAGVSCNKFLAKVASDWRKPNGIFTILPSEVDQFVIDLDVSKIPGVGKVTTQKLNKLNIYKCKDLRYIPISHLTMLFGKMGKVLHERSFGRDNRNVESERVRKSLSVERTFEYDKNIEQLKSDILYLESELAYRLQKLKEKDEKYKVKQVFLKMKFSDFKTITCEEKKETEFLLPINNEALIDEKLHLFFLKLMHDSYLKSDLKVRLLGIGVRFATPHEQVGGQLDLFAS